MWQQKENLFSDRFVVPTWLKRAAIYSHVSLLEENVHMAWTGFSSGVANQKQAMDLFTPRAGGSAAPEDPSHCTVPSGELMQGWNAELARLMQVAIMVGCLKLHLLQISLEIFVPDQHSKWNLGSCCLLLLLLLAEMQWSMSTLRKYLCLYNYGIQLFSLLWWCRSLSYHHWPHTEIKICSAEKFNRKKCYFSSYPGSVLV